MRDYENLTLDLRERASSYEQMFGVGESSIVMKDAADAIEELVAMACPHYHRNVHDRGDDSYCDVLNTEPPKEETE